MRTNKQVKGFGFLAAAVLAAGIVSPIGAASAHVAGNSVMKLPHHMVVFGDGLTQSSEPGQEEMMDKPYGYVERLYESSLYTGRTLLKNYGLDGLTSEGLRNYVLAIESNMDTITDHVQPDLRDLRAASLFADIPATLEEVKAADLITINLGLSDYGDNLPETLRNQTDQEFNTLHSSVIAKFSENVRAALTTLHQLAPEAEIVIGDAYSAYPANADKRVHDRMTEITNDISETLDAIVESMESPSFHLHAAHVADAFVGHEMEYTHILESDNRPTQEGYEMISQAFSQAIWGGQYRHEMKAEPINLVLKGHEFKPMFQPELINDRAYVGLRELAAAVGAEVSWDEEDQAAMVSYRDNHVTFKVDSSVIYINGEPKTIEDAVQLRHEGTKTYVPLRAISEGLGFDVQYIPQSNTAFINE